SGGDEFIIDPEADHSQEVEEKAIEEEAASLLAHVLMESRKIPVNASAEKRARLIKESLDKIPLTPLDWNVPARQRMLDQIKQARDSSNEALQREGLSTEARISLTRQIYILNDILELTSRSTKKQEAYLRSRKGELALSLTTEQERDRENARFIESKLISEMSTILRNLPDEILARPTPSELYLHVYKALKGSPSLEALYALRAEMNQRGSGEAELINESLHKAFLITSQAIKGRIPALERLAGRDKDAQDRLAIMKQLPDVVEQLLLEDPAEQKSHVRKIVRSEYKALADELTSIDTFFSTTEKPTDLEEHQRQQKLANRSADIQFTMGTIQSLAEEAGIDLDPTAAGSTDKVENPVEEHLQRAA
ncbi:hypothetical protein EB052_02125, partial [bacterium]|nr:hypothetical protein [bacterium]